MGEIILERFNGRELFSFDTGRISVHEEDGRLYWVFDVHADGKVTQCLPDTVELKATPSVEAFVLVDEINSESLKDNRFSIPLSYNEESEEYLSTFYYVEHEELDNNQIKIKQKTDNLYTVKWSGTTVDVNYYDGNKPATKVFISGDFLFDNRTK